jgi:hypothetical protein
MNREEMTRGIIHVVEDRKSNAYLLAPALERKRFEDSGIEWS